jgi:hypothetical protein
MDWSCQLTTDPQRAQLNRRWGCLRHKNKIKSFTTEDTKEHGVEQTLTTDEHG